VADNARADFIECGDHIPPDLEFDVILSTHDDDEDDDGDEEILCNRCGGKDSDNTYHLHRGEYFCVPCYGKPAKYDWPAIDRYGDEARPE
jgi:ribosomal protein L37E